MAGRLASWGACCVPRYFETQAGISASIAVPTQDNARVEADLLQHVAKCAALEDVVVEVLCAEHKGRPRLAFCPQPLMLRHVPALAACTRLVRLSISTEGRDKFGDSALSTAQELLAPLASLPALREVGQTWTAPWQAESMPSALLTEAWQCMPLSACTGLTRSDVLAF